MGVVDDIEFLEVNEDRSTGPVETIVTARRPISRVWPLVALVCFAAWVLGSAGGGGDTFDEESTMASLLPPVAPISPGARAGLGIDPRGPEPDTPSPAEPSRWPSPPLGRDPSVVRIPGDIEERLAPLDRTLVYVNSLGHPTVVSFGTGDVSEVDVAAVRIHQTFAVEAGQVRSLHGTNPDLADASSAAVVFHTYRDVDPPGLGTTGDLRGVLRGPELCLSDTSCVLAGQGVDRRVVGGVEVDRFDPDDHDDVAEILDTWQRVDRWLVAPDGYRIPAPARQVWVITPRGQGGASSTGVR